MARVKKSTMPNMYPLGSHQARCHDKCLRSTKQALQNKASILHDHPPQWAVHKRMDPEATVRQSQGGGLHPLPAG